MFVASIRLKIFNQENDTSMGGKNCFVVGAVQKFPQGFYNAISSSIKWFQESYFKQHPV